MGDRSRSPLPLPVHAAASRQTVAGMSENSVDTFSPIQVQGRTAVATPYSMSTTCSTQPKIHPMKKKPASQSAFFKLRLLLAIVFAVALSAAPQLVTTASAGGTYSARLISPRVGQVLYPGQHIRVEWKSVLPNLKGLAGCEMEVWLSVDGGRTFLMCISPWLNPKDKFFDWTVPNMPTNAAVMDIRFGCEVFYPETYAPQPASTFVIAQAPVI